VNAAIRAQNAQVSAGAIGDLPNVAGRPSAATVVVPGQLSSVEQFGNIVLRANTDGSTVRLKDVARIELGAQTYATGAPERQARHRHRRAAGAQRQRAGHGQGGARAHGAELQPSSRPGVKWAIPYDSSRFVKISIRQVVP
jgi:multidrug efflux pump